MPLARDLLNPSPEDERRKCKLKRLVQQAEVFLYGRQSVQAATKSQQPLVMPRQSCCASAAPRFLCQPTGGRARLTEGCSLPEKAATDGNRSRASKKKGRKLKWYQ
uniref:Putative 40s ribosomal protein s27 n=1 Tax=Ixodes ricinus TaxID=34613 RepID=A0A0K8RCW9_IXORI